MLWDGLGEKIKGAVEERQTYYCAVLHAPWRTPKHTAELVSCTGEHATLSSYIF
jgi:hypothetical protein